jgi:regulator of cell morphogenesis and NO signaling
MSRKVAAVHGDREPRLIELRQVFETFHPKVVAHTREEEDTVFPAIRDLDRAAEGHPASEAGLRESLANLEAEHNGTAAVLARFKELTHSHTPPEWACNTFRALYDLLAEFERNTHQHIHKEDNVLFPKVLSRLEEESADPSSPVCYAKEFKDW